MDTFNTNIQAVEHGLHNNEWIQLFINNMPYPTLLVGGDRNIIAGNQKYCDFYKLPYTSGELNGRRAIDIVHQVQHLFKNPYEVERRIVELISLKRPVLNDRIETTDGRIILRDYQPFEYQGGFVGHLWIFYDETDTIKPGEIIREQKHFYEDVLNKIPSDIAVLSPEFRYLFVNPEAISNPETRKWIIGKNDFEFCRERGIDIKVAENRKAYLTQVLTEKKELEWEETFNRNNSVSYHIRRLSPVLDEGGNVKLLIGYGYDITQRKRIEEQIAINERRYKDLFNFSQALICTHDMQGNLLEVNPAFCEQTGYTAERVTGKSIRDFLPAGDKPYFEANYLVPIENNQKVKGIFRVMHNNGNLVYLLYQNYKVELPGEDTYVISFSQDITERIKIEKELKDAKKLTEETARMKEKFLANMSHEIRTPMNGIMGITSLLQKTPLNEEQAGYLKIVQDSAHTLLNIINDILDLEKINTGNVDLEIIPFDIKETLASIVSLFRPIAQGKNLQLLLVTRFEGSLVVAGDPTRFTQIMNNLISNAIKFTHEGQITVTAWVTSRTEDTVRVHIAVKDTGIGIAGNGFEKIFSPFTQADRETTRVYGGTGLGLAITKNLVEIQNGRIWIDSKLNIGSTFHIEIPFNTYKHHPEMSQKSEQKQNRTISKKVKVLLAEDNDINQLLANKILQHFGFEARTADNGSDAIQMVLEDDFDVILMDIQMPVKNGIETAMEIRALADEKKKNIPIIALTANALKGEEKKYFAAGMNGYLTKPFKEKELYEAISIVLPNEYLTISGQEEDNTDDVTMQPASQEKEAKVYNLDDLRLIQKDDDAFVKNIVGLFIQNVPKNAAELVIACDNGDWERVYFLAHKMKSSIELVNMETIKSDVRRVELNAKTRANLEEIPEKAAHINVVVEKAVAQMKEEFGL